MILVGRVQYRWKYLMATHLPVIATERHAAYLGSPGRWLLKRCVYISVRSLPENLTCAVTNSFCELLYQVLFYYSLTY